MDLIAFVSCETEMTPISKSDKFALEAVVSDVGEDVWSVGGADGPDINDKFGVITRCV